MVRRTVRKAFTLVEILIVVVILGILAAIVVPQFTNATQDAQGGNLQAQLSSLQRQIGLYAARNNGTFPDFATNAWTDLTNGGYIKNAPRNPAWPSASAIQPDTVAPAAGTTYGSATTAWVWNTTARTLCASYFKEIEFYPSTDADRGKVTTTNTD